MKIENRWYDKAVTIVCILCFVAVALYLFRIWGNLPDEVPAHYNAAGEVDRMSGKGSLLVGLSIGIVLYTGVEVLSKFPNMWNTGVEITSENKERVYRVLKNMINSLKLSITVIFGFITVYSTFGVSLPVWFLPALLGIVFVPMIYFGIRLFKQ